MEIIIILPHNSALGESEHCLSVYCHGVLFFFSSSTSSFSSASVLPPTHTFKKCLDLFASVLFSWISLLLHYRIDYNAHSPGCLWFCSSLRESPALKCSRRSACLAGGRKPVLPFQSAFYFVPACSASVASGPAQTGLSPCLHRPSAGH